MLPAFIISLLQPFKLKKQLLAVAFLCFEINYLNGILNIDLTLDKLNLFLNKSFAATKKCWKKFIEKIIKNYT